MESFKSVEAKDFCLHLTDSRIYWIGKKKDFHLEIRSRRRENRGLRRWVLVRGIHMKVLDRTELAVEVFRTDMRFTV